MKPIIHIGYPKTASTWFQDVFFPEVKNVNFISNKDILKLIIRPSFFEFNVQHLTKSVFYKQNQYILSCEDLIGHINAGWNRGLFMKENANRLKALFKDATIVILLRKQPDAISSAYSQYIKTGGTYNIKKYLSYFTEKMVSLEHFNYLPIINYYISLFGEENIKIYLYEDFKSSPKEFIRRFTTELNIEFDEQKVNFNAKVNKKLHPFLLKTLRLLNYFSSHGHITKIYYINIPSIFFRLKTFIYWLNEKKIFNYSKDFSKTLLKHRYDFFQDYYKKSNNELLKKYNLLKMKNHNYPL